MENKIIEVKLAILDRILSNVKDETKSLDKDTLTALVGIVESFDRTEEMKKQPKSDPDFFYKAMLENLDKALKSKELEKEKPTEVL